MLKYLVNKLKAVKKAVLFAAFLFMPVSVFAAAPYLHAYLPGDKTLYLVGDMKLWATQSASTTTFEMIGGAITKCPSITAALMYPTVIYFPDGTYQNTAASGNDILSLNNVFTGTNEFRGNVTTKTPFIPNAGVMARSITKYQSGPLYIYTLGEDLISDTSSFYLNTDKFAVKVGTSSNIAIGTSLVSNSVPNSIYFNLPLTILGSFTATTLYGHGTYLTGAGNNLKSSANTWSGVNTHTNQVIVQSTITANA